MSPILLAGIGVLLLIAKFAEDLTLKAGLPGLVGPLAAGILLSQTPLKAEYKFSPFLFVVGLNFVSFLLGAEELGSRVEEVSRSTIIKGTIIFSLTFLVSFAILFLALDARTSALIASTMAMTSTTRIYSLLKHTGLVGYEDVLVVSSVSEVLGMLIAQFSVNPNLLNIVILFIIIVTVITIGEKIFRKVFEIEENFAARELPLSMILAMVISVSYFAQVFGVNSAIMALILGILASEYLNERPWIKKRITIITHSFFEPLFLIGAGLSVTFNFSPHILALIIIANFVAALVKVLIGMNFGWEKRVALATAIKGGVDSAILTAAWERGLLSTKAFSAALITITLNTFVLALLFRGRRRRGYMKVCDLELDRAVVDLSEPLSTVVKMLKERPAVVVVDALNWPIGYITAMELIDIPREELEKLRAVDVYHEGVPVMRCEDPVNKIILLHEELEESPVVAVVKEGIGYIGSLYPTRVIKVLEAL